MKWNKSIALAKLVAIAFFGCLLMYAGAVIAEHEYMAYKYSQISGHIENVRSTLKNFQEMPASLDDLGPGYLNESIFDEDRIEDFTVFKYETILGGYFHVIYDEKGMIWDRAPTGFADIF